MNFSMTQRVIRWFDFLFATEYACSLCFLQCWTQHHGGGRLLYHATLSSTCAFYVLTQVSLRSGGLNAYLCFSLFVLALCVPLEVGGLIADRRV